MGGARGDQFLVTNASKSSCTIDGTPGVTLLDSRGRKMGSAIRPEAAGSTTLAAGGKATFEVLYHSCVFAEGARTHGNPKNCKWSAAALVEFRGVKRIFRVREKIDAIRGVEQVMSLEAK